jgi:ATP-dependent Lon protease
VLETIPPALLDRMELVMIDGYTEEEKVAIARDFLVPRQLERAAVTADEVTVTDDALRELAANYTREAGVRVLERLLAKAFRKVALGELPAVVDEPALKDLVGRPRFTPESRERTAVPGVASGLAVTGMGGDVLYIEASSLPGEGGLTITGQLGDVMKESAQIALSYVRAEVGMTGEVSLTGRVLPIGGVKQKLLAAQRAGLTEVYLPQRNEPDLDDVPAEVLDAVTVHIVSDVREILATALEGAAAAHAAACSPSYRASPPLPWAGDARAPWIITDATTVKATVDHSQSETRDGSSPAA